MDEQNSQTPQFEQLEKTNKFGTHFVFLFTLLIISLAGVGLVFVINSVSKEIEKQEVEVFVSDRYADWKTYRSSKYGYEISYPNNWSLLEDASEGVYALIQPNSFSDRNVANSPSVALFVVIQQCEEYSWNTMIVSGASIKAICHTDDGQKMGIELRAGTESEKVLIEEISSTFKFTK